MRLEENSVCLIFVLIPYADVMKMFDDDDEMIRRRTQNERTV